MKVIYVTDLHGNKWKFERIFELANDHKVKAVINGGDLLPESNFKKQESFISHYLDSHFAKFDKTEIYYIYYPGNNDPRIFDPIFERISNKYPFIICVAQSRFELNGFEFVGMNWVVDYPFLIKDRCRMDTKDYLFQEQYGKGKLSTIQGWQEIDDWFDYAKKLPTIEDELNRLAKPKEFARSIYILHMPPAWLGLDSCAIGINIGSKAIYNFINKNQPRFSLHGHIHESPDVSGHWKARLGNTLCIQPGQKEDLTYVIMDLETKKIERTREIRR